MHNRDKYGKAAYDAWCNAQGGNQFYEWEHLCEVHPSIAESWRMAGDAVVGLVVSGIAGYLGSINSGT